MIFYLGTHMPHQPWFDLGIPLFVSRERLVRKTRLPTATAPWALDSGGYSTLRRCGMWPFTDADYAEEVLRYAEIGNLAWAAPMDWMCEPTVREKTGLTVGQHQFRTLASFIRLRELLGELVIPVLQGWELGEHEAHIEMYEHAGIDLAQERVVGVGSVCRRNADREIAQIVRPLAAAGLRLHAFGVRSEALGMLWPELASADSMAWSYAGRRVGGCGLGRAHKTEANCKRYALRWRAAQNWRLAQMTIEEAMSA